MAEIRRDRWSGDIVSVSSARQHRPLTFEVYEAPCPFCPGPESEVGTNFFDVATFANRYPAWDGPGRAEVVVYSPNHHADLAALGVERHRLVFEAWRDRTKVLEDYGDVQTVFVFENRGPRAGQTIAHPHGQIYGYPFIPPQLERELNYVMNRPCPGCGVSDADRVLVDAYGWRVEVPEAARMPYQIHLIPKRHCRNLLELTDDEVSEGADLFRSVIQGYDDFYGHRAEYVMAIYQAPKDDIRRSAYHLRIDWLPIWRGDDKVKFIAGSELAMETFIADMDAETIARRLRPFFAKEKGSKLGMA